MFTAAGRTTRTYNVDGSFLIPYINLQKSYTLFECDSLFRITVILSKKGAFIDFRQSANKT